MIQNRTAPRGINLLETLAQAEKGRPAAAAKTVTREKQYDPNTNTHATQPNLGWMTPWNRDGYCIAEQTDNVRDLLREADLDFTPIKALTGYVNPDADLGDPASWTIIPNSCVVIRPDKTGEEAVLAVDVTKEYNATSFWDFVKFPEHKLVTTKGTDGTERVQLQGAINLGSSDVTIRNWIQANGLDLVQNADLQANPVVPLSDLLEPASVSGWQGGRAMTANFLFAVTKPWSNNPKRECAWSLVAATSLDGTAASRFWLVAMDTLTGAILLHTKAEGFVPVEDGRVIATTSIKRTAKMSERAGDFEKAALEALHGAVKFDKIFTALSMLSPEAHSVFMEFIEKGFDINIKQSGKGKRDMGQFQKIIKACMASEYGLGTTTNSWGDLWIGVCCYLSFDRQVNSLADEADRREKLMYKQLIEEDGQLAEVFDHCQHFAGIGKGEQVTMGKRTASVDI